MKCGLEYFALDVNLDDKIALIEAEFGLTGFAVIVKLFQKIYGQQGYYCDWNDDVSVLFCKQNGISCENVSEIVNSAMKRGIFNREMFDRYSILTSSGIQKRYLKAVSRRVSVDINEKYILVDIHMFKNVNICKGKALGEDADTQTEDVDKIETNNALALIVDAYQNNIAPIRATVRDSMIDWLKNVEPDVIVWAIQTAVKANNGKWSYVEGILRNQFNAGNKTLADVMSAKNNCKKTEPSAYENNNADAYDFDSIEKQMWERMKSK